MRLSQPKNREVFPVSEVVKTGEDQTYLKLADGRGWVRSTQSLRNQKIWEKPSRNGAFRSDKRGIELAKIKVYQI